MVINDFYAITVGHLGECSDAPEFLTCSIKMVVSIVCYDDVQLPPKSCHDGSCTPAGSSCSGQ